MSKVLVIGCGGVAGVAISKCCQVSEVFTELCIASRTKSKCDALAAKLAPITKTKITTAQVDADDVQQLCDLIQSGHTKRSLKRPASLHCSAAALTRASRRRTAPTLKSTSSIPSIPSIFWTATAAITVMRSRQTSIRRSTCARFLRPAAIGKTATGSKSRL